MLVFWFDINNHNQAKCLLYKLDHIYILATTHIRIKMDLDWKNRPDTS